MLHPSGLWREIGEKLLADLVVNEGTGWLQRQEAASRLLEHPAAGPHLIEACVDLVEDPHRPAVIEPLSLLDVTADPVANAYVLKQLESPDSDRHHQGALLAAVRKIENGHFRGDQWERLSLLLGQTGASGEAARLLGRPPARTPGKRKRPSPPRDDGSPPRRPPGWGAPASPTRPGRCRP
ncbi:hypothetical protein [Actinoplanes sp. NPDC048796]|uniref:hypothetical protein n=1 Tax=Actinoplanes sp. NPDC048796 TaxID=3155640 RepID=UPI0033FBEFB6